MHKNKFLKSFFTLSLLGISVAQAQVYSVSDIGCIEQIVANNFGSSSMDWNAGDTANWEGITWDGSSPRRIIEINIGNNSGSGGGLTGHVDFSCLPKLQVLRLESYNSGITGLDLTGLTELTELNTSRTDISSIDLSTLTSLEYFRSSRCYNLTGVDVSGLSNLQDLKVRHGNAQSLNLDGATSLNYMHLGDNNFTGVITIPSSSYSEIRFGSNNLTGVIATNIDVSSDFILKYNNISDFSNLSLSGSSFDMLKLSRNNGTLVLDVSSTGASAISDLRFGGYDYITSSSNIILGSVASTIEDLHLSRTGINSLDLSNKGLSNITYFKSNYSDDLTEVILTGMTTLQNLELYDGAIETMNLTGFNDLSNLQITYNRFDFKELVEFSYLPSMSSYNYSPQDVSSNGDTSIEIDATLNYADFAMISGNPTTFTLYDDLGNFVSSNTTGLFSFPDAGYFDLVLNNNGITMTISVAVFGVAMSTADITELQNIIDNNFSGTSHANINWSTETNPIKWNGVKWDPVSGRVTEVNLHEQSSRSYDNQYHTHALMGAIELRNLDSLRVFSCAGSGNVTDIYASGLQALETFNFGRTSIDTFVINDVPRLTRIHAGRSYNNLLRSLEVSDATSLSTDYRFRLQYNLQSIDMHGNTYMPYFHQYANSSWDAVYPVHLNLSGCTNLSYIQEYNRYSLQSLDASTCSNVDYIYAYNNVLTDLNVDGCNDMTYLQIENNSFQDLVIENCASLNSIAMNGLNNLESFTMRNCDAMNGTLSLTVFGGGLTDITIEDNAILDGVNASNNVITSIAINNNAQLNTLTLTNNAVATAEVTNNPSFGTINLGNQNIQSVSIENNTGLTSIDLSNNDSLSTLSFGDITNNNNLTSINFSNNSMLNSVELEDLNSLNTLTFTSTPIKELSINNCSGFTTPDFSGLGLEKIFFTNNTNAISLDVSNNELVHSKLNLEGNSSLASLAVNDNYLEVFDITDLPTLNNLDASNNSIELFKFNGITSLNNVDLSNNPIEKLDMSSNTGLIALACENCELTSLNTTGLNSLAAVDVSDNFLKLQYIAPAANLPSIGFSDVANQNPYPAQTVVLGTVLDYSDQDTIQINGDDSATTYELRYASDNSLKASNDSGFFLLDEDTTFYVIMTNSFVSLQTGDITVVDGSILSLSISGNGGFGELIPNVETSQQTLTLTNEGNKTINVSSLDMPENFSASSSNFTIGAGSSVDVTISFNPPEIGHWFGNIVVNSDATIGYNKVYVDGSGAFALGIANNNTSTITMYPNPANSTVFFKGMAEDMNISVYNSIGLLVGSVTIDSDKPGINISQLARGMYYVRSMDGTFNGQLLKQ